MTSDLTKISFNATRKTVNALEAAAETDGFSRTDVLNRAVQVYEMVTKELAQGSELMLSRPDGSLIRVKIL